MTLLVSAVLLCAGALMALKLPRVMDCGASGDAEPVRLPAQAKGEVRGAPVEQAG